MVDIGRDRIYIERGGDDGKERERERPREIEG